jgi:mannan endo-1,4-beta-mannosidase
MDVIATQLQKFQDAHIPVLWRPLHEAEGGWFWWGAKGPEPFKKLWRLEYDRFTNYHHLNNLLWVYSSGTDPNWYPGDKYVDIVGIDAYPSDVTDPESSIWIKLVREYGGRKMLALTEFGGVPDISRMRALGVRWSYFYSWTGSLGAKGMPFDSLKKIYGSPGVLNADKLPAKF